MKINKVNFGSTYEISTNDTHINSRQEVELIKYSSKYNNTTYDSEKGFFRFSVEAYDDDNIEKLFKSLGIKVYKKFSAHNIPWNRLNKYIKDANERKKFKWIGK